MRNLETLWIDLRSSLWFVPALVVIAMVTLAVSLIELDVLMPEAALARFPRVFGAGAEGTRGMLSAIAGSMITVAGTLYLGHRLVRWRGTLVARDAAVAA